MSSFKNMKYKLLAIVITFAIAFNYGANASAALLTPAISSTAGIVVDTETGQVIVSKDDNERLPIASMSKLIVIYMIEQKIKAGVFSRNEEVTISNDVAKFSQDSSVANVAMTTAHPYSINDLETAALLPSSNSAAMALAELVSGSQTQYYKDASELLSSWGIKNVQIYSASGLSDGDLGSFNDPNTNDSFENTLSAREVAKIASHLVNEFPDILTITKRSTAQFPDTSGHMQTIKSTDNLLSTSNNYNIQGLKTGTTPRNGVDFTGFATVNGRDVVTVTLNAPKDVNFTDTTAMLDLVAVYTKVTHLNEKTDVTLYNADATGGKIEAKATNDLPIFYANDEELPKLKSTVRKISADTKAPIEKGTVLARSSATFDNNKQNDYLFKRPIIEYTATSKINKANFIVRWYRQLTH